MCNKVIYVHAPFRKYEVNGETYAEVDGAKFSAKITDAVAELSSQNYKIISVVPIISGRYAGGSAAGSYCMYTEGATIVAEKL
jgi:hypothetical protein